MRLQPAVRQMGSSENSESLDPIADMESTEENGENGELSGENPSAVTEKRMDPTSDNQTPATDELMHESSAIDQGFVDLFTPCSAEKGGVDNCGEVDKEGRALYEVCSDMNEKFYWDSLHPTQKGWHSIMLLYSNGAKMERKTMSFTEGAPNVNEWLHLLGFDAYGIS